MTYSAGPTGRGQGSGAEVGTDGRTPGLDMQAGANGFLGQALGDEARAGLAGGAAGGGAGLALAG